MNIKEVSETLSVSENTLRTWEKDFNIVVKRGLRNRRKYDKDVVKIFAKVKELKSLENGYDTIRHVINTITPQAVCEQNEQNDSSLQAIIKKELSEHMELAEKYARATYTIGQLEAEKKALELQVQEFSERIKLLPSPSEHNNLKKELELIKRPLWKKILSLFTNR